MWHVGDAMGHAGGDMIKKRGVTGRRRNWQIKNVLFQNCCTGGKTILRMLKLLVKSIII